MADYLKIPEVARRLDVSEPTVRRMVKSGKLPSVFIGGAYRVSVADLEEFVENARVEPGKAGAPPRESQLFDGLEDEWRPKLEVIESGVQYIIGRAEYWKQELERGRTKEYATYTAAQNLFALATEEFSDFNGWLFGVVARDLNVAIDSGDAPREIDEEYAALLDTFVEHIVPTQHMLSDYAARLAETQAEQDEITRRLKAADANVKKKERRSA